MLFLLCSDPPINLLVRQQPLQRVWLHRSLRNQDFMREVCISRSKPFTGILKFFGDFKDVTVQ